MSADRTRQIAIYINLTGTSSVKSYNSKIPESAENQPRFRPEENWYEVPRCLSNCYASPYFLGRASSSFMSTRRIRAVVPSVIGNVSLAS